jgi:nucleoside-diphosphate-sugar epimerase
MKALVIGGDGSIGSALTKALLSRGDTVCQTTRRSVLAERNAIQLDLASFDIDALRLPEADVAFFCAAITSIVA